jgi:hypothetical protein
LKAPRSKNIAFFIIGIAGVLLALLSSIEGHLLCNLLLDKGTEFFLGGLLGLFGFARPRLVGAVLLWLDGLAFGLELLGLAALFGGVTVVPAMHLAEVGVVGITVVAIAVVVVATILLLGGLLLVVAIVHNGAFAIHCFGIFKAFHEVNNFSGSVIHRIPVLLFHLDLPAVGSGKANKGVH